jgi:serine/threonine protein kinase
MEIANSVGTIFAARYQLAELLGEGGSGSTYRAIRLEDGAAVAIKILSLRHLNDWKQLELFEREAKVLSQLNHPQIPKYLEYFHIDTPENRAFYIVQQLAPGKPLTAWVQSGWRGTEAEVRDIASQLLAILQYLHQHSPPLIHRDLKPHNIIRNDDGRVFLVDFGAVQAVYNNTLLKGSTVAGTFGYMAPEQFRGLAVPASDLYGLGATILYLLTHRSPADLPQARLKLSFRTHVNISNHFADWLEKMLEPDTSERFSSADVALSALQKQHRFRVQRGHQIGFPWKGAIATALISVVAISIFDRYRYAFLGFVGLQPRGLCTSVTSVDYYLAHGGNIETPVEIIGYNEFSSETSKGSILHCAVFNNRPELIDYLLRKGANPHAIDDDNKTPLDRALIQYLHHKDNTFEITFLIKNKADRNLALFFAVDHLQVDLVKQLIGLGANPSSKDDNGSSLVHKLADFQHFDDNFEWPRDGNAILDITKLLLEAGARVNDRDKDGNTALMLMLNIYVSHQEDLKNSSNRWYSKVVKEDFKIITYLLNHGANPNLTNTNGVSSLHLLSGYKLSDGRTPREDRCISSVIKDKMFDLLIKHGAKIESCHTPN